jgi:enediyne biosynthesis protein E9
MNAIRTDVLIIGSGFGAAAPALRLSAAGHSVVVVEKGPDIEPRRDFRQTQDPQYLMKYLKSLSGRGIGVGYAEALGGGSGFYEMVSLRAPGVAFRQTDEEGRAIWPAALDRAALDPWYDVAEPMLRVQQISEHEVPKTGQVFALMMRNLGYSCDRARYAVRGCIGSGFCVTGCIYGAKQSLHVNYLPAAREAGATFVTGMEALAIQRLASSAARDDAAMNALPWRYEVTCRSTAEPAGRLRRYRARVVIVAGGTISSARLLLASRRHLRGLSRQLGRNIAFNGSVRAAGILPPDLPDTDMFTGRSHPGMISYEFLESDGITVAAAKPLPIQLLAGARIHVEGGSWWGGSNVTLMKQYRHRMMVLYTLGLSPSAAVLQLDERGRPTLRLEPDPRLTAYRSRARSLLDSILSRNGCTLIQGQEIDRTGQPKPDSFSTMHQTGSCRMADSPSTGVVDPAGEVFGSPGLYVSDGASIPGSLAVNVSLTILANAERIAAGVLARHGVARA